MQCDLIQDKFRMTFMSKIRRYSEFCHMNTFDERLQYLMLKGAVGKSTFGFDRYINQMFYTSSEWKQARTAVIVRDNGCDLGVPDYAINGALLIHHINPITVEDITHGSDWIFDPEYLITTTQRTHNAIHYGDIALAPKPVIARRPGDTKLW